MMDLVVATRNAGKLKEIRRLLESQGVNILGLESFPDAPEVEEDDHRDLPEPVHDQTLLRASTMRSRPAESAGSRTG